MKTNRNRYVGEKRSLVAAAVAAEKAVAQLLRVLRHRLDACEKLRLQRTFGKRLRRREENGQHDDSARRVLKRRKKTHEFGIRFGENHDIGIKVQKVGSLNVANANVA